MVCHFCFVLACVRAYVVVQNGFDATFNRITEGRHDIKNLKTFLDVSFVFTKNSCLDRWIDGGLSVCLSVFYLYGISIHMPNCPPLLSLFFFFAFLSIRVASHAWCTIGSLSLFLCGVRFCSAHCHCLSVCEFANLLTLTGCRCNWLWGHWLSHVLTR